MPIENAFSYRSRPQLLGSRAAIAAAHPLATAAAQHTIESGGSAADAAIAAHAVIAVVAPEAGGLGGDGFFLVRERDGTVTALNAAGAAPRALGGPILDDGSSVTVPGLVDGWSRLSQGWGKLPLKKVLSPAVRLARDGVYVRPHLLDAIDAQRERLFQGGANSWPFMAESEPNAIVEQGALARTLESIGDEGAHWFYEGPIAGAVARAVGERNGWMAAEDLASHETIRAKAIEVEWGEFSVHLQPPVSQGVLLGIVLNNLQHLDGITNDAMDHALVELTNAAFLYRKEVGRENALLSERLTFDPERASRSGGPRSYLHTAGVAAADRDGLVISSLLSVFDDFGSAIYVPEGGFVLNNRGAGFTEPPNQAAPTKRPVHTLSPIIVEASHGECFGLATPGADGQIQTLLQILIAIRLGASLPDALTLPRWRSEDNRLLIEESHTARAALSARGHNITVSADGDLRFGGVVCAGIEGKIPFAVADWRRENWSGVV